MKILIVGAGWSGATIAHILATAGHTVHVIDRRNHIAGNAYDYTHLHEIRVHKYGPHLFHTNNEAVYKFIQQFGDWVEYKHKVLALYKSKYYVLPPNKSVQDQFTHEQIINIFYRPYTKKMWGYELEEIDPSIIDRVKIRDDNNEYYFPNDKYQVLPKQGYTSIISKMLDHTNINVDINQPFNRGMLDKYDYTFYSGAIDEFYKYEFGSLQWRSIKFNHTVMREKLIYPVATVNFTDNGPHTRVTEWKHLPYHGNNTDYTICTSEEPCHPDDNLGECYYPVKDLAGHNRALYKRYTEINTPRVKFIGRCGNYAYLDMDQAISSAQAVAKQFLKEIAE